MTFFLWFFLGVITGAMALCFVATFYLIKLRSKRSKQLSELIDNMKQELKKADKDLKGAFGGGGGGAKYDTDTKAKMAKVREITERQLELRARAEGPQRNAMDGKYKNTLIRELKALDDEKFELLNGILEDGHDPTITTINEDGSTREQKLSQFLLESGRLTAVEHTVHEPLKKEDLPPNARRVGKFVVYSKPDPEGDTSH